MMFYVNSLIFFGCYHLQTKFAKVMFLHVSVILSTGGGGVQAHAQGGVQAQRGVSRPTLGCVQARVGVSRPRSRGVFIPACTEADTHPTGMHSCSLIVLLLLPLLLGVNRPLL